MNDHQVVSQYTNPLKPKVVQTNLVHLRPNIVKIKRHIAEQHKSQLAYSTITKYYKS